MACFNYSVLDDAPRGLALRTMVQGSYQKAHSNPKGFAAVLADELIAAGNGDSQNSYGVREKERVEREAGGAR